MFKHLFLVIRKIIGSILIVLGIVGAFIPIPLVPFFLLTIAGLGLIGVRPEIVNKVKLHMNTWTKKLLNKKN